jgi:hypothetical protein
MLEADALPQGSKLAKGPSLPSSAQAITHSVVPERPNSNSVRVQFEREMMLERQREGIAKAKAESKYRGRAPTVRRQADEIRNLAAQGMKKAEIARRLKVSGRSVYRVLSKSAPAA